MNNWLFYSFITTFLWGLWGLTGKLASRTVSSQNLLLLAAIGSFIVYPLYIMLFSKHFQFQWNNLDNYLAIIGGILGAFGGLFFYMAISKGEISRVVAITATYPAITVLLAWIFLHEAMTIQKGAGILFAVVGIYLLSL